jgi:hypothetical protein
MRARHTILFQIVFLVSLLEILPAVNVLADGWLMLPSGWGQQPDPAAEARNQRIQDQRREAIRAREEIERKTKLIQTTLATAGLDAFRKYSDGTVAYMGFFLYRREGLIATNSAPPRAGLENVALIDVAFRIEDVTDEGCRITPLLGTRGIDRDIDLFIVGLKGYSGRKYSDVLMVRHIGSYQYKTVTGATRVIPKMELGERATKDEYKEFFWGKKQQAAQK